jgi:general secretion pathway protein G
MNRTYSRKMRLGSVAGFTLLEMVIVLGIIAVIMGGVIVTMKKFDNVGKIKRVEGDFNGIESALMGYQTIAGHYPSQQQGLKALVEKPTSAPRPRRWTQVWTKMQLDPWGKEYIYKYPGTKDRSRPEIICLGEDGLEGTEDDMSSQDE